MKAHAIDLFAGPGGWDLAARELGFTTLGVEHDPDACHTRANVGLPTLQADVSELDPYDHRGTPGLIASPPCPAFSMAGNRDGHEHLDALAVAIHNRDWQARPSTDPEVWLVLEVGRWVEVMRPTWIACEQVPAVLPLWEAYADVLRQTGWSAWAGVLNAADYGVPQTRRRAILIANRWVTVQPPPPTHSADPHPSLFGDDLLPWVTMADALGWPDRVRLGFPRLDDTGTSPDGYLERDWRSGDEPAFALTEKARSWTIGRPATTVCGDPRLSGPGRNDPDTPGSQYGENSIRLDIRDALLLQSFPPGYPLHGTKTSKFKQVGNAVPPRLAAHVLKAAKGQA